MDRPKSREDWQDLTRDGTRSAKLALGTVQFGLSYGIANRAGQVSRSEAKRMLQLAATNGIDTLDTAIPYGESEACLGELGVQSFKLVTKLPAVPDGCTAVSNWVQDQIAASMARLGVSQLYGLLLHRPEQLLGPTGRELYQALQGLKDSGRVQKIGVSIYAPSELDKITKLVCLDLVQAPFNLVDRRLHTTGWLQRLKDNGIEIHTRSVFLQGLLLMPREAIPTKFAAWSSLWEKWHRWLSEHDASAVRACLAFPLGFDEIDRVVVGADSAIQLAKIIEEVSATLSVDVPELQCDAESLINPSRWAAL
ncbi:MAG: aldo/keto reductase [Burkholderiales bacterium]|nr:aldo/keto reductase [Burkholderiales bacterium]